MSQTLEDQRKMEQLGLNKEFLQKLDDPAKECPYDPINKPRTPSPEQIMQFRQEEIRRRQVEALAKKTADQILPKGGLVKINGRLFKVKSANPREVRLRILPMGR